MTAASSNAQGAYGFSAAASTMQNFNPVANKPEPNVRFSDLNVQRNLLAPISD